MFAPRYRVPVKDLVIEMGPPQSKSEVEQFAVLMSNPRVSRYLGRGSGFTPDDEADWYEKTRSDKECHQWLLFDVTDDTRKLIGTTGYHNYPAAPLKTAITGCQIADLSYWGKGIAKATHCVRTWQAFARDGIVCLRSAVFEPNVGSRKALESVGYVVVAKERNQQLDDGEYIARLNLECVNPDPLVWRQWWHGDTPPRAFQEARKKSAEALEWVRSNIKPFET